MSVEAILHNAKIATNGVPSFVEALAIGDGKITATGTDEEILRLREPGTRVIDGKGRTIVPGLNDSHMHPIRGGLNYNMELRWDGVPSLADALRMLKEQAARTPALSGSGWSVAGPNFSSPNDECPRLTRSIRLLPTRPFLFSIFMIVRC